MFLCHSASVFTKQMFSVAPPSCPNYSIAAQLHVISSDFDLLPHNGLIVTRSTTYGVKIRKYCKSKLNVNYVLSLLSGFLTDARETF